VSPYIEPASLPLATYPSHPLRNSARPETFTVPG